MSSAPVYPGRLGLVQRVLPGYRLPFFDTLAANCAGGLSLFAGQPTPGEGIVASAAGPSLARLAPAKNLHFLSPDSPFYLCHQRGLIRWLEDWNPDALIVEANFRYLSTPAALDWMRARRRPVIGWGLGAPASRGPLDALRRGFLARFDALIAYSQRGAQQYAAGGFPAGRIFTAPNAVAPAPSSPPPSRPADFGARPGLLFVGRLQARKRIPALLRACAELPVSPRLVIVGDGPEMDSLRADAERIFPSAEFVGAKHGPDLDVFFRAADLFVLPGTGGLAVQQAMSHAMPVIVAQGDGTQDDLVRPANGWQIPPGDDAALLAALREALSDPARLRRMGTESYRIVAEEINIERMSAAFVQALNQTSAGGRA